MVSYLMSYEIMAKKTTNFYDVLLFIVQSLQCNDSLHSQDVKVDKGKKKLLQKKTCVYCFIWSNVNCKYPVSGSKIELHGKLNCCQIEWDDVKVKALRDAVSAPSLIKANTY